MNFIRMNRQRQAMCPTGYIWATNIDTKQPVYIDIFLGVTPDEYIQVTKDKYRKQYGEVQIVTPAYDNAGNELNDGSVAIYVPHPAIRRVNKWLRNNNKMKGGNLPY